MKRYVVVLDDVESCYAESDFEVGIEDQRAVQCHLPRGHEGDHFDFGAVVIWRFED